MKKNTPFGLLIVFLISCEIFAPPELEEYELLDGPIEGLNYEESRRFIKGDAAFDDGVFTIDNGLGPIFNGTSCLSCHAGEGKGHPFNAFIRFGQHDETGNHYLDRGGPQLQDKAIPGYEPETLPEGAPYALFLAPAVTGLGYLDAVTDEYLLSIEDPNDENGDGIKGRVHWTTIPDYVTPRPDAITQEGKYINRFGKKASVYDLLHQTVLAFNEDLGITSRYNPYDTYSGDKLDPEVSNQTISDIVFYLKTLKAPIQRDVDNPKVIAGKETFENINCAACHRPTMETGYSPISVLSYKTFHPYTDLLLHDMGSELDDGYTEGHAKSSEWRTAPLWGLGLSKDSQGGKYYLMHDGRAKSIDEAIQLHGGEAANSRDMYNNLSKSEKDELIQFLESL